MSRITRWIAVVGLVLVVAAPIVAQEKGKKKKGGGGTPPQIAAVKKQIAELDLSAEQKTKIEGILSEYAGKLTEGQKKVGAVLTPEQRKTRQEAIAKAREDGKKGKELQQAGIDALKLGPDAQEKLAAAEKELVATVGEMRKAVAAVLTEEQRAKAGFAAAAGKGKGKAKKRD